MAKRMDVTEEERQAFQTWAANGLTDKQALAEYRKKFPESMRTDMAVRTHSYRHRKLIRVDEPRSLSTEILALAAKVEKLENENRKLREDNEKLAKFVKSLKKVREAVENWQDGFLKGEY